VIFLELDRMMGIYVPSLVILLKVLLKAKRASLKVGTSSGKSEG
jgi:hypothetical protein